ncbi:division/cell wall cluster transcriptional repressor MraZ [Prevotella ihumii]|uniref:division/cell wall cluster transcriptional repressor MraZ n=1 Tax=Prevotella ihumii TaxID=1917878 RepID=UPI000981AACD|nr:division/cell wall cluster transcriptional repressor MraZ [Prevotella ihumii]
MRFLGNIEAKTDAKGRAFLPATFRKILNVSGEESLIMKKDVFQPCLVLYPESVWNEMLDNLRKRLNRWNSKDQMIYRQFVSDVEMISLDGNGRFLIPKRYLKLANIDQQIKFIGMDDCIEIWPNNGETAFLDLDDFSQSLEAIMGSQQGFMDNTQSE